MSSDTPTIKQRMIQKLAGGKTVTMEQLTEGMTPEARTEFIHKYEEAKAKYAKKS